MSNSKGGCCSDRWSKLLAADVRLSQLTHDYVQRNPVIKLFSDIVSLSSDEIVWFGVSSLVGCLIFCIRYIGQYPMGCIEEAAWDCFGSCAVGTCFESLLKWIFRRTRPSYSIQSGFHSISGEWYSFPSGHSLRAFYWTFWLTRSRFVKLLRHILRLPRARYFIPWAALVGWSRVAKGRHFALDVVCGGIIGLLLGYAVEDLSTGYERSIIKTVCGAYTVINWGYLVVIPTIAGDKIVIRRVFVGVLFYLFAFCILFNTLPAAADTAGLQTVLFDEDSDSSQCTVYW